MFIILPAPRHTNARLSTASAASMKTQIGRALLMEIAFVFTEISSSVSSDEKKSAACTKVESQEEDRGKELMWRGRPRPRSVAAAAVRSDQSMKAVPEAQPAKRR